MIFVPFILLFLVPFSFLPAGFHSFAESLIGRIIALILFVLASLTDLYDGRIARARGLVSNFGKFLDPIADKMLVISVMTAFVELGRISTWVPVIVIAREFAVTGIRLLAADKGVVISASQLGKLKAVIQMSTLIWLLIEPIAAKIFGQGPAIVTIGNILVVVTLVITVISGIDYLSKSRLYFGKNQI